MYLNKGLTYLLLAAITFAPWNATAVNNDDPSRLSNKSKQQVSASLPEALLVKSLLEISQGKNKQALNTVDELIQGAPNFKLAHLIRGDLLMAQARYLQAFGSANINPPEAVKDLQAEAKARLERYSSNENAAKFPDLLLAPNELQSHVIVVDTDKSRLYLYKNEGDRLSYVADYYVTVGKNGVDKKTEGDKRTPIGVYFAKQKLTQPLADMYGDGAYPLNYPNEWDMKHNRNGSGIWLHGTYSSTYSRPPNASDGCVVLSNQDLNAIAPILQTGKTPVIIANNLKWVDADNSSADKDRLKTEIDSWLKDWKSQDTSKYLSHYSEAFSSNGVDFKQWANHKTLVQASRPKVDINISNMSIFSYPESSKSLMVVDFVQDFRSPSLSNKMWKRQYWIQEHNAWKIIYEGEA